MIDRIKRLASSPALRIDPTCPRHGFVLGFLLGPIGVGVLLRSVFDFLLSLAVCTAILTLCEYEAMPLCWLFCGAWTAGRLHRRRRTKTRQPHEAHLELEAARQVVARHGRTSSTAIEPVN
jgi:hypothetical protein